MTKIDTEYLENMWPMRHFLITCGDYEDKSNIITVSFCMPVSKKPPLIAFAIAPTSYSYELIKQHNDFVVNVPTVELKSQAYYCGFHSGRDVDKFKETSLTPEQARKVNAPVIKECFSHMECIVREFFEVGDKVLFVGEVVESYGEESIVKDPHSFEFCKGDFPKKIYGTRFIDRD